MSRKLIHVIREAIPESAWPMPGEPLIVAVSGGADSVALAHLLDELNRAEACRWQLHVVHLNHGLRPREADADAAFVVQLAEQHGWQVTVETRAIRDVAEGSGRTMEECGRDERYALFQRVLDTVGGEVVATAHHADDNAETILQRFCRGTGLRGLAGIPAVRPLRRAAPAGAGPRIIRPLLPLRRHEIRAYLERHHIPYRQDTTNDELGATRNRIRHELIPRLESDYNPAVIEAILRLGRQCRWFDEHVEQVVHRRLGDAALEIGERAVTFSAKALTATPAVFRTELVRRAIVLLGCGEKKLSFQHLLAVTELAERKVSGKRLELPGGLCVTRQRDRLRLERT